MGKGDAAGDSPGCLSPMSVFSLAETGSRTWGARAEGELGVVPAVCSGGRGLQEAWPV